MITGLTEGSIVSYKSYPTSVIEDKIQTVKRIEGEEVTLTNGLNVDCSELEPILFDEKWAKRFGLKEDWTYRPGSNVIVYSLSFKDKEDIEQYYIFEFQDEVLIRRKIYGMDFSVQNDFFVHTLQNQYFNDCGAMLETN